MLICEKERLLYTYDGETMIVEPWSKNALRVRSTMLSEMPGEVWALNEPCEPVEADIGTDGSGAYIRNGRITARISRMGKLTVENDRGVVLLEEYMRTRSDPMDPKCSAIEVSAREFKPNPGGDYHLTMRFESKDRNEKLYGMGQYQQPYLNLKGLDLELAQRNSQVTIPFMLSDRGYGFFWNNPAVGRAVLGGNIISFEAYSTKKLDYWVVAGDTPAEILQAYASVTGRPPMMPEYGLGYWQCKLRYQTQEELLGVAREYRRRGIPVDVIVCDYFHWPLQGDWKFDPVYWPDPEGMVRELRELGMELMVSVWPSVDRRCERFEEMIERGYLVRTERGHRIAASFHGEILFVDFTNPGAREYLWNIIRENYASMGIRMFWLDVAEPEYSTYDFDNFRYFKGPVLQVGNLYPLDYVRTFSDGMKAMGEESIICLTRSAWAGSQKYGALVWSGDIASSFESMRSQLRAGLSMSLSGMPWWTTDIGGFYGGDGSDPEFRELLARWFAWGAYLPVMRMHGDRKPTMPQQGETGGACCLSGSPNEIWSFGPEIERICEKYIRVRESMRDYIRRQMALAHADGTPVMRPLFYDFPEDPAAWEVDDAYMFGPDYLVAPVTEYGVRSRRVYLPGGAEWVNIDTNERFPGGQTVPADAPLDVIPVFRRS